MVGGFVCVLQDVRTVRVGRKVQRAHGARGLELASKVQW